MKIHIFWFLETENSKRKLILEKNYVEIKTRSRVPDRIEFSAFSLLNHRVYVRSYEKMIYTRLLRPLPYMIYHGIVIIIAFKCLIKPNIHVFEKDDAIIFEIITNPCHDTPLATSYTPRVGV